MHIPEPRPSESMMAPFPLTVKQNPRPFSPTQLPVSTLKFPLQMEEQLNQTAKGT